MPVFFCSAILFDLDGVLVDSTGSVAEEWRLWSDENKVDVATVLRIMHGRRTVEIVRHVAPHLDAEAEARKIEQSGAEHQENIKAMPGALELLRSMPAARWAVVTSGTRYVATARLQHTNLPMPRVLVAADDVTRGKPEPEPYLKGAAGLGIKPAECLVVEDAPAGIESAHACGMKVIGLTTTYSALELQNADAVAKEFRQIQVTVQDNGLRVEV